jgi:quercetin dioxygenase-like cupin family protein
MCNIIVNKILNIKQKILYVFNKFCIGHKTLFPEKVPYSIIVNERSIASTLVQIEDVYAEAFSYYKNNAALTSCDFILFCNDSNYINTFNFYNNYTYDKQMSRKDAIMIKGHSNRQIIRESLIERILNINDIKKHLLLNTENQRGVTVTFRFFKNNFKVKEHTHSPSTIFCYMAKGTGNLYLGTECHFLDTQQHIFFRGDTPHSYDSLGESILLLAQLNPL